MAATDNLHPGQLQMFMRPSEIMAKTVGSVEITDRFREESPSTHKGLMDSHMKDKLQEAQRPGSGSDYAPGDRTTLVDSVAAHGVEKPIILSSRYGYSTPDTGESWIGNGHHRLAAAQFAEQQTGKPQYVPVIHDDDFMGSPETNRTFGTSKD